MILDNPEASKNNNCVSDYAGGAFSTVSDFKKKNSITELDANIQDILNGYVITDYKSDVHEFFQRFNDNQEIVEFLWSQVCTLSGRIDPCLESEVRELLKKGKNLFWS